LASQYSKEDKEEKRTQIAAQINLLGAQAQLAQGNTKAAIDLYQHGETMTYRYATLEAEKEFKRVEADLKEQGLSDEKAYREASIKAKQLELDIMAKYRTDMGQYYKQMGAAAAGRGGLSDPKIRQQAIQKALSAIDKNPRILMDLRKQSGNSKLTREDAALLLADEQVNYVRGLGGSQRSIQRGTLPEGAE
jgi:hypothetical protein